MSNQFRPNIIDDASLDRRTSLTRAAEAAVAAIAGSIIGTCYVVTNGAIDILDAGERSKLAAAFTAQWLEIIEHSNSWLEQAQQHLLRSSGPEASKFQQAAARLIVGLVKTEILCRAAIERTFDEEVNDVAYQVLGANMAAIDYIFTGDEMPQIELGIPSSELLQELPFAKAFFERKMGLR